MFDLNPEIAVSLGIYTINYKRTKEDIIMSKMAVISDYERKPWKKKREL